jgi:FkbM family methyltransferase
MLQIWAELAAKTIKHQLKSMPLAGGLIRKIGRRYSEWNLDPPRNIRAALGWRRDVYIVQIGANDGKTGDPIHSVLTAHAGWHALFIEPVPFLFHRLKQTYDDPSRFRFENVAITGADGMQTFYYVDERAKEAFPDLPTYYDQLGSFARDHITRHLGRHLEPFIVAAQVPTASLSTVLARNGVKRIDLLHIDTEGSDWMILRQLNLAKYVPSVILFEHKHLPEADKQEARMFLKDAYKIKDLVFDYFCRRRRMNERP